MVPNEIGVYVHWPFCTRLCPYCDFNIYKNNPDIGDALAQAIVEDLEKWREMSGPRDLLSLHYGGGTPSLMSAAQLSTVLEKAKQLWSPRTDIEIAMEANPGDVTKDNLEIWRNVGIERVSIGVQSFDDKVLKFLGRNHDSDAALSALQRAVDFTPRVSADLIYGWAGQSADHWRKELQTVVETGVTHISAYQLTIEEKTAFAKAEQRGEARAVDVDTSADLFESAGTRLKRAGYERYEVSNFAKTAADRSRHNLIYWRGGDYVGVGPGAHGRLTSVEGRIATVAEKNPRAYIDHISRNVPVIVKERMSPAAQAEEYVLMGLRIHDGISLDRFKRISGHELSASSYQHLIDDGLLTLDGGRLSATDQGRLVLDTVSHILLTN